MYPRQRYTPELINRNTEENIKKISNIYQENPADILTEHNLIFPKIEENDYDLIIPSKYGTILEDMEPIEKCKI
ncbi:hypothetical protein HZS_6755 [Henneguya salminicola]|nr:hypothetical protein HZS_6755 [Henneguya salminicola]